jgi:hypothetical protein
MRQISIVGSSPCSSESCNGSRLTPDDVLDAGQAARQKLNFFPAELS